MYIDTEAEFHSGLLRHFCQPFGEQITVPGFIIRQLQATRQFMFRMGQRRFCLMQFTGTQQAVRHAFLFQNCNIIGCVIQLFLCAE